MHRSRGQTEIDLTLLWAGPNGMGGLFVQNGRCATALLVPPLRQYVSGPSTLSAAAADFLTNFYGCGEYCGKVKVNHAFPYEPVHQGASLALDTWKGAAAKAGSSRLWDGIRCLAGNRDGQKLDIAIGSQVFGQLSSVWSCGRPAAPLTAAANDGKLIFLQTQLLPGNADNLELSAVNIDKGINCYFGASNRIHAAREGLLPQVVIKYNDTLGS